MSRTQVIMFVEGKPVEINAELYENSIKIKGIEYAFTGLSRYLKGAVLFLNLNKGLLIPMIPAYVALKSSEFFYTTINEINEKTREVNQLVESIKLKKIAKIN